MKKLFSFVVATLFATATFAAVQYCQKSLIATAGSALLSLKHVSANTYEVELVAQDDMLFTAAFNINCGVNQTKGAGIGFVNAGWVISEDKKTATFEFTTDSEESVPTDLYGNYMCFQKTGGTTSGDLVEFSLNDITDIDWTATCAVGPADTEAPVMGTATVASASFASITLDVTATDNVAVRRYHVVTTPAAVDADITPSNGQIVVKGLATNTAYSMVITAKDAAGNVSANSVTVNATTLTYPAAPAAPTHVQADVRSIYSDTYDVILEHDFLKNTWSGIAAPVEIEADANNHYLAYTTNAASTWIAWGENNDGNNAIIAAEGYASGKEAEHGLDISKMDNMHVDLWVDVDCPSVVMTINDTRLAELGVLKGTQWNSLDLPLSDLTEDQLSNLRWLKFDGVNGLSYFFIDNVYAWKKSGATSIEQTIQKGQAYKTIENGQVVIIRDGVRYSVMGNVIR